LVVVSSKYRKGLIFALKRKIENIYIQLIFPILLHSFNLPEGRNKVTPFLFLLQAGWTPAKLVAK